MIDHPPPPRIHRFHHGLFVCTHNDGRSQMTQALFDRGDPPM